MHLWREPSRQTEEQEQRLRGGRRCRRSMKKGRWAVSWGSDILKAPVRTLLKVDGRSWEFCHDLIYAGQDPLAAVLGGIEGTATEQGKTAKTSSNSQHKIKTKGLGVKVLSKEHKMRGGCSSMGGRWEGGRENRIGVRKALGLIPARKANTHKENHIGSHVV